MSEQRQPSADGAGDPRIRALVTARLCASAALGAYQTASLLYLVRYEHLNAQRVGLALTIAGLAALAASPAIGRLAGRGGAARLGAAALLVQGAAAAAIALAADSFPRFALLAAVYALANSVQMAVRGALVAALVPPGGEAPLVARLRTSGNIGLSIGIPVGGWALSAGAASAYRACLLAAAGIYGVAAALMARAGTASGTVRRPAAVGEPGALTDRRFVAFVAVTALQSLQYPVLTVALPLWVLSTSAPRWVIAAAGLTNTGLVIALQVPATRRLSEVRRAVHAPIAAGLLVAAACLALAAARGPSAPIAVALLGAAVLALTLAEVAQIAAGDVVSFAFTPERSRHGAYQGLYSVAASSAQSVGPWLIAALVLPHALAGWLGAAALFALAGPLTPAAARLRPTTAFTAAPDLLIPPPSQEPAVHVLAATRRRLDWYPVAEWAGPGHQVTLLGSTEHTENDLGGDIRAVLIDDYTTSPRFDLAVLDAHREQRIDHLFVFSEFDVLRAARLREHLGIRGQGVASALAYRDKVRMKEHWASRGVPAAAHTAVSTPADLLAFGAQVGYPIVVKPRAAMGASGVHVLADPPQARAWITDHFTHAPDGASPWMAEAYVEGRMLQVDGVYHDGIVEVAWPTSVSPLLAHLDGAVTTSVTLESGDPLVPRAQDLVTRALAALPDPAGPIIVHAEVWVRADGTLLMNEVAARIGGAATRQIVQLACGVDLARRYVRCTLNAHSDSLPARPTRVVGHALVPPGHGRLRQVPALPEELTQASWMRLAEITGVPGRVYHGPALSADAIAQCLVTGTSAEQVTARLARFTRWCSDRLRYDDPHITTTTIARTPTTLTVA